MRVSRLLLVTLRDVPAEAEIASHQLLLRGGYIRRVGSGIYAYLPLMWKVIQRITAIVREELNAAGAQKPCFLSCIPLNFGNAVVDGRATQPERESCSTWKTDKAGNWD